MEGPELAEGPPTRLTAAACVIIAQAVRCFLELLDAFGMETFPPRLGHELVVTLDGPWQVAEYSVSLARHLQRVDVTALRIESFR